MRSTTGSLDGTYPAPSSEPVGQAPGSLYLVQLGRLDPAPGIRTGMRKGEILSIQLEHIDVDKHAIYIPKAKAGARVQPITEDFAAYLKTHMHGLSRGGPWLFPSTTSATGHTMDISTAFRQAVVEAGLDPATVTPHTLRHTAISHLIHAGVDLPTVQRVAGHANLTMTARYAHQNGDHIAQAMDKLQSRYTADTITPELHKTEHTASV